MIWDLSPNISSRTSISSLNWVKSMKSSPNLLKEFELTYTKLDVFADFSDLSSASSLESWIPILYL